MGHLNSVAINAVTLYMAPKTIVLQRHLAVVIRPVLDMRHFQMASAAVLFGMANNAGS